MRKEKMRTHWEKFFFNAICLHDTKEKHKEIQQLHLVCDDLSPPVIPDPAVSITQMQQLDKEMFKETVFLCSAVGGKEVEIRKSLQQNKWLLCFLRFWQRVNRLSGPASAQQFNCCRPGNIGGREGCYWGPHFSKTCQKARPLPEFDMQTRNWVSLPNSNDSGPMNLPLSRNSLGIGLQGPFYLLIDPFPQRSTPDRECEGVCVCVYVTLKQGS